VPRSDRTATIGCPIFATGCYRPKVGHYRGSEKSRTLNSPMRQVPTASFWVVKAIPERRRRPLHHLQVLPPRILPSHLLQHLLTKHPVRPRLIPLPSFFSHAITSACGGSSIVLLKKAVILRRCGCYRVAEEGWEGYQTRANRVSS